MLPIVSAQTFVHYADRWSRQTSPAFEQCDVRFVPVFLGGIMNACGNTAPINIKSTFLVTCRTSFSLIVCGRQGRVGRQGAGALGSLFQCTYG